ncbi:Bug family tripartite tricarboxylate transporter substrate binding protein [Roseomonas sp. GCM10028921]
MQYGTPAAGSMSHCALELFRERVGNPAMQDPIAGRFSAMFDAASVVARFVKAGQVRAIAVTGKERRVPAFPDVATVGEQGLNDLIITSWSGIFASKCTPVEVVQRVNAALNQALRDPAVRERISGQGNEPGDGTPEAFDTLVRGDHARWGRVVKEKNIVAR